MKYWRIGQIQKTEKVKMLETITTHIDIVKFIERGKKMLNAKLERHLTRPHTLPYEVMRSLLLYIYILIWFSIINILYQLKLLKWLTLNER